ncbi:hypothetical protein EPN87_03880 [archaeon]|nr:MAG: hypothetical protein EPN87_03880 [archaeon]
MALWLEVAKFAAGFVASDLFAHATFLVSNVEPKVIGIHFTHAKNKAIIAGDMVALLLLVYIAWFSGWQI